MKSSLYFPGGKIRLLRDGLTSVSPVSEPLADPLSPEQAAASGLCPAGLPFASLRLSPFWEGVDEVFFSQENQAGTLNQSSGLPETGPVYLCGECSSSMDVARFLAGEDALPIWGSVLALSQRSGRGQLGRSWSSPPGNVYAALRLPLVPPFTETAAAPALGGLIATTLSALGFSIVMKWPNDLLRVCLSEQGPTWRKVGGILLEQRGDFLVAGIGINLVSAPSAPRMRTEHALEADCLGMPASGEFPVSALSLWARLVSGLVFWYGEEIITKGEHAWLSLAERHLAFRGKRVLLADGPGEQEQVTGILEGLDLSGGLRLRNGSRSTVCLSGSLYPA